MNWDEDFGSQIQHHDSYIIYLAPGGYIFEHPPEIAACQKDFSLSDKEFLKQCGISLDNLD